MLVVLRSCTRVHLSFIRTSFAEPFRGFQQRYKVIPVRMVEGHGCHRVAHAHRKLLVGKRFVAKSPNGRFTEGESALVARTASLQYQVQLQHIVPTDHLKILLLHSKIAYLQSVAQALRPYTKSL